MGKIKGTKGRIAGKTKRLVGEILGDPELHDEGKTQEQEARKESDKPDLIKPLGNLDKLT